MSRYHVRVQAPSQPADAYVTRGRDGLPRLTTEEPEALTLDDAEDLLRDTVRTCGAGLLLGVCCA